MIYSNNDQVCLKQKLWYTERFIINEIVQMLIITLVTHIWIPPPHFFKKMSPQEKASCIRAPQLYISSSSTIHGKIKIIVEYAWQL